MKYLAYADSFQNQLYQIILSGIPLECHFFFIQLRPDVSLVQTACKVYQQTAMAVVEKSPFSAHTFIIVKYNKGNFIIVFVNSRFLFIIQVLSY